MSASPSDGRSRLRPVDPPRRRREPPPHVLVVGGGIIGLACARELARNGTRVEVIERLGSGAEASTAAAGMLAPLLDAPHPGPYFDALRSSRNEWPAFRTAIEEESGLEVDYDDSGALVAALDSEELSRLETLEETARGLGEAVAEAEITAVRRDVPALSPAVQRVLRLPGEHRVDNVKACAALARAAEERGVTLTRGREVQRVEATPSGVRLGGNGWRREADLLIVAAGAWSGSVPGLPRLPVQPVRGQMALLGGVEWEFAGIVRAPDLYTVRRGVTGLLVGSTVEEAGFDNHTTLEGLERLLAFTRRLLPGISGARVEATWAGLRPGTPDGQPILGRLGELPVVVATGHYRNGILLTPWTARVVAAIVLDGAPPPEARPFDPGRFGGEEQWRASS